MRNFKLINFNQTDDMESMAIRMKREARGTGNLPTKTG